MSRLSSISDNANSGRAMVVTASSRKSLASALKANQSGTSNRSLSAPRVSLRPGQP